MRARADGFDWRPGESALLSRDTWLAQRLGPLARLLGSKVLPISQGIPFGVSVVIPPNFPLPTKIVTQLLEPIDALTQFGDEPDLVEVDAHARQCGATGLETDY